MTKRTSKANGKAGKAPQANGELGGLSWKEISARYPQAIKGSLQSESSGKYAGKRTVEIRCAAEACKARRRVATSDLFQVRECTEHVAAARAARRAARRAEAKAES